MAGPVLRTFVQKLMAFSSRLERVSDVISSRFVRPIVLDKCVKFRDPRLNHSREIQLEAISSVAVNYVGMDVCAKFGDSRSNGS